MKNKHHQQTGNRDAERSRKTRLGRWMLGFITRLTILAAGTFVVYNEFARYAAIAFLVGVMSIYLILKTIGGNSQFKQKYLVSLNWQIYWTKLTRKQQILSINNPGFLKAEIIVLERNPVAVIMET